MTYFECGEQQFIENIRVLLQSKVDFVVNRRIRLYDDKKYGLSNLPNELFADYELIASRKAPRQTTYAKTPFLDEFHNRVYFAQDILHSHSKIRHPVFGIPYYKVEYSFKVWSDRYSHEFDVLFKPRISIRRKKLTRKMDSRIESSSQDDENLIHVLQFDPPSDNLLVLNLPKQVVVLDYNKAHTAFEFWE